MPEQQIQKILFVDFNGVISYDDYWKDLVSHSHPSHNFKDKIEDFLFQQESQLVNDWMLGKYSSEQIHQILNKKLGVPYEKLFFSF